MSSQQLSSAVLRLDFFARGGACLWALLAAAASGCASWEETLHGTVDPVNRLIHHELRDALRSLEGEKLSALGEGDGAAALAAVHAELAGAFRRIENADCIIEKLALGAVDDASGGGLNAETCVILEGESPAGERLVIEQDARIRCRREPEGPGWRIAGYEVSARRRFGSPQGLRFVACAEDLGLRFHHRSRGVQDRFGKRRDYLAGSGLSARDVDRDGHDDLLLVGGGELRLFLWQKQPSEGFRDASADYGLAAPATGECRAAFFGDYDNDGDADFFLGVVDGPSWIYRLDRGRYTAIPGDELGIPSSGETTGACWADFDRDGLLDLYVVNGGNLLRQEPEPIYDAKNGAANRLLRNLGNGRFEDVTERAGVGDTGWGLGCQSGDFDGDGDLDLFVANDFSFDVLYLNRGDGSFENASLERGIDRRDASMGITCGDADGDGDLDLFVSAMYSNSVWMIHQPAFPVPAPWPISALFRGTILEIMHGMMDGNRLYLNQGSGRFSEAAKAAGVHNSGWAWGGIFLDVDNDADLDLYVLNGFVSGKKRKDL